MFNLKRTLVASAAVLAALSAAADAAKYDPRMALEKSVTEKGVRWIDGKLLPIAETVHFFSVPMSDKGARRLQCHNY